MYYTYVLHCVSSSGEKRLYIGSTENLRKRFNEHIHKKVLTTKKFAKIILIYYEACLSKTDSLKREIQLKTGFGRGYLKKRLENSRV